MNNWYWQVFSKLSIVWLLLIDLLSQSMNDTAKGSNLATLEAFNLVSNLIENIPVPSAIDYDGNIDINGWKSICSNHLTANPFAQRHEDAIRRYEILDRAFQEIGCTFDNAEDYPFSVSILINYLYFYMPHKLNNEQIEKCQPVYSNGSKYPTWV